MDSGVTATSPRENGYKLWGDLACPAPIRKISRFSFEPNHRPLARRPAPDRGAYRDRHGRWDGMRWTRQRRRASWIAGRALARERSMARGRTAHVADGKAVWSWHPLLVSSRRRLCEPDRALLRLQSAGDGDKTNSSPRRARSKPLKPLRRECRVFSGVTCGDYRVLSTLHTGLCNGPRRVNPFLRHPLAGYWLLSGIGAWPSPDGFHERNRSANLRKT